MDPEEIEYIVSVNKAKYMGGGGLLFGEFLEFLDGPLLITHQ